MRIRIYVVELSPRAKFNLVVAGAFALLSAMALPADAMVPHSFSNGQTLSATDMNDDFNGLDTRVSTLETFTTTGTKVVEIRGPGNKKWSLGATYCGVTPGSYNGSLGGYATAKSLCESVTGCSPSAHMCTSEELVRTYQMGVTFSTEGWYSQGAWAYWSTTGSNYMNDCAGWTSTLTNSYGPVWNYMSSPSPSGDACNLTHPVICCD
jgi:hypothetical protein